jgi:hypothetical protein
MKRKPPIYVYESVFAKEMRDHLKLRGNQGYQCLSQPYFLKTLDAHLLKLSSAAEPVTSESADAWIHSLDVHHNAKLCYASRFRKFAKHLYVINDCRRVSLSGAHKVRQFKMQRKTKGTAQTPEAMRGDFAVAADSPVRAGVVAG